MSHASRAGKVDALAWGADLTAALTQAWSALPAPEHVVAVSVVHAQRECQVQDITQACFGKTVRWLRAPAAACGVRSAYAEPQRLGVDRFAAMLAAFADGLAPCVIAGCGTALTLDALTADGRHLGGLIAPGPPLMQQAVLGATAQVHSSLAARVVDAADNTGDALSSGCWQAGAALIDRFCARMADALGGTPQLLLGGGDAEQLLGLVATPAAHYPNAVLRGLARWVDEDGTYSSEREVVSGVNDTATRFPPE